MTKIGMNFAEEGAWGESLTDQIEWIDIVSKAVSSCRIDFKPHERLTGHVLVIKSHNNWLQVPLTVKPDFVQIFA